MCVCVCVCVYVVCCRAEYLSTRHGGQQAQRQLREQVAALQAANAKQQQELTSSREAAAAEVDRVKAAAKRESQQFREYARQQAQQREDDLRLLKEQYAEVQAMYETRVRGLETKVAKVRQRYRTLERRRNLELEGFTNDIAALRRAVLQLEGQVASAGEVGICRGALFCLFWFCVHTFFSCTKKSPRPTFSQVLATSMSKLGSSMLPDSSASTSMSKSRSFHASRSASASASASASGDSLFRHVRSSGYGAQPARRRPSARRRPTSAAKRHPAPVVHTGSPPHAGAGGAHSTSDEENELPPENPGGKQALAAARVRQGVQEMAARVAALRDQASGLLSVDDVDDA